MNLYLSGKTDQFFVRPDIFGVMLTWCFTGRWKKALDSGCYWMLDNGAYSGKFVFERWIKQLTKLLAYKETCLGVVIPDAPFNFKKTLLNFYYYYYFPKQMGYPIALVTQDGILELENLIPWDSFDVLFVGGSDKHKRGEEGRVIIKKGLEQNKHIHIGRVSSTSAIKKYWPNAHTYDGTTFVYGNRAKKMKEFINYFENKQKEGQILK